MTDIPFTPASDQKNMVSISRLFSGNGSNFIFEFELHRSNPKPDFSICVQKHEIPGLAENWQNDDMKDLLKKNKIWEKVLHFCLECAVHDSLLGNHAVNVWFEFDHHQLSKHMPEPCLFFSTGSLSKKKKPENISNKSGQLDVNYKQILKKALGILLPEGNTNRITANVEECAAALPQEGAIFQIGYLLARNLKHLRLCTAMPVKEYPGYLKRINWPGDFDYLEPALQTFKGYADGIFLDLDVGEDFLPIIGIECYYSRKESSVPKKVRFFNLLCELEICTETNANIILDWLSKKDETVSFWKKTDLKRRLSHIKVTIYEDHTATAKVYLSLSEW